MKTKQQQSISALRRSPVRRAAETTLRKTIRQWIRQVCLCSWVALGLFGLRAATEVGAELLVKCEGGPSGELARAADAAVGATVVRRFEAIGWHLVRLPADLSAAEGTTRYRSQPGVLDVEPNQPVRRPFGPWPPPSPGEHDPAPDQPIRPLGEGPAPVVPDDPRYRSQWNLKKIGMEQAWAITTGSADVVVAVIDTGVNYLHPDLAANMWRNPGETGLDDLGRDKATNGVDDDGNGYVDDVHGIDVISGSGDPMDQGFLNLHIGITQPSYHGTSCAGIIGAIGNNNLGIAGINWNVRIMALAMTYGDYSYPLLSGPEGHSISTDLAAFDYLVTMKNRGVKVRVASNSYQVDLFSTALRDAFRALNDAGILMVFSAGNDGRLSEQTWWRMSMVDSPNILVVTGVDRSDRQVYDYGMTSTDLAAPTIDITTLSSGEGYVSDFTGTSAACPHVAGAAALLCAASPDIGVLGLKAALLGSVDPLPSLRGKTRSQGRLNVVRSLQSLTNPEPAVLVLHAAPASLRTDPSAPIEVIFSEAMDRASVEAGFQVNPTTEGTFHWAEDHRSFRFEHPVPFVRTNYVVSLSGTIRSVRGPTLDGNFSRVPQGSPADDYSWTFGFPIPNDDLAGALIIEGAGGEIRGNNTQAIAEEGEPDLTQANTSLVASLWYRWSPPTNGWYTFDLTRGTGFDTTLGVFRGTDFTSFPEITSNNDYGTRPQSRISFPAQSGEAYTVVIGGNLYQSSNPVDGNFTLRWYPTPPPGLTTFTPISGFPGQTITLNGTNLTGTTVVKLNGAPVPFASPTNANFLDLRLMVTVPAGATSGLFTVETPYGHATAATEFTVNAIPTLVVEAITESTVILSWPDDASGFGFVLQAKDALDSSSAWRAVSLSEIQPPIPGRVVVGDVLSQGARFYRLRRP